MSLRNASGSVLYGTGINVHAAAFYLHHGLNIVFHAHGFFCAVQRRKHAATFTVCPSVEGNYTQVTTRMVWAIVLTSVSVFFHNEAIRVYLWKLWLRVRCCKEHSAREAKLSTLTPGCPTLLSAEVQ